VKATIAIGELARKLHDLQWEWSLSWATESIQQIGGKLEEEVNGRLTYRLEDDYSLSIYHEGHNVLFVEGTLEAFGDVEGLSPVEYEDKVDEFFKKYEGAVAAVERVLGRPRFNDGAAAAGFPADQEAVWLALWPARNARFMIQQKHEDRDLPFRLCVVVAPVESR
jgi:hypothetical protein